MPLRFLCATLGALVLLLAPLPSAAQTGADTCDTVQSCEAACAGEASAACAWLAHAYGEGSSGVEVDVARATAYAQRACELGLASSCHGLGRAYEQGGRGEDARTAEASLQRATVSFGRACSAGLARACGEQARLLLWGAGGKADPRGAVALFTKGCSQGDGGSCEVLAALHAGGLAVPRDSAKAELYARQAKGEPLGLPPYPGARAAELQVTTEPPGLPVLINGMLAGTGPVTVRIPAGVHRVETRHGSAVQVQTVTPAAGQKQRLVLSFPATLEVVGSPSGASVAIDGQVRGPLPWKGSVTAGQHEIYVQAEGHAPSALKVSVLPGTTTRQEVTLAVQPARLRVSSEPSGAAVLVDGKRLGQTPFEGDVAPGPHTLKVELEGHLPHTAELASARAGQLVEQRVKLTPAPVPFRMDSDPKGAEVWVDGKKVGVTPFVGVLPPGPHRVALKQPGFDPVEKVLQVAAGVAVGESLQLVVTPIAVEIDSRPGSATVRIDGREVGRTRWKGTLPPGPHALELTLEGHAPVSQKFVLLPGQRPWSATPTLKALPVELRVESDPAGAEVLVDGRRVGLTPHRGTVLPGTRRVTWRKEGHATQEATLDVVPARAVSERRKLEPTPIPAAISSVPVGAALRIDGKAVGTTPWSGTLVAGRHRVELTLAGHAPLREEVALEAGMKGWRIAPALVALSSPFTLESTPAGAEVFVDAKRVGTTPYRGTLAPGAHQVEWRLPGYATAQARIVAAAGREVSDRRTLIATPIPVEIAAPAGATVTVGGKRLGVGPWKGSLPPGRHVVEVALAGHTSSREELSLAPGDARRTLAPKLSLAPIAVRVETTPPGAEVRVEGRKIGTTPFQGALPAAPFALELVREGYQPVKVDVRPVAGREVVERHVLEPRPVTLRVVSEPPGAALSVDGKRVSLTPWEGTLAPGAHQLELTLAHHEPVRERIAVETGRDLERRFALVAQPVPMHVEAVGPASAEVYVDGERQGTTPLRLQLVPGKRTVEVRAEGFSPRGETLTLAPGSGAVTRSYTLAAAELPLRVTSTPDGAEVWVDGARVGRAPWEGRVSAGAHAVSARAKGHEEARQEVEVAPGGEPLVVQLVLKPGPVQVEFVTEPAGALLTIDGKAHGASPLTVALEPGEHRIEMEAPGFETVRTTRALAPGERVKWAFDLKATPVPVGLVLRPPSAELLVDGEVQPAGLERLMLLPGKHRVMARLANHTTVEKELVVTRAGGQKLELMVVPTLEGPVPPTAPGVAAVLGKDPESLRRALADPREAKTTKVQAMRLLAPPAEAVAAELARVQPAEMRGELCLAWGSHLPQTWLSVETVDSFGEPTSSTVSIHGQELGQAPLRVRVPVCVSEVTTGVRGEGRFASHPLKLAVGQETSVTLRLPGRPALHAVSLFGEAAQNLKDYGDGMQTLAASGVRYEYFGRIFHLSVGVKGFTRAASVQALGGFERFPLVDATAGLAAVLGNDGMRVHLGLGVGVWSLVVPTARASVGFNFGDRLYLSAQVQAHVAHPALLPDGMRPARYQSLPFESFVYPSAGLGLGWIFR